VRRLGTSAALFASLSLLAAAPAPAAPPPHLTNARVETRAAADIEDAIRAAGAGPAWIAWAVPVDGPRSMCCWSSVDAVGRECPGCRLEGEGRGTIYGGTTDSVELEKDDHMAVLVRVAGGGVDRIRHVSWSCGIDAGGRPFVWLADVSPAASLRFLAAQARSGARDEITNMALAAVAGHAGDGAVDVLVAAARRDPSAHTRGQALFWLAQRAGARAAAEITRAIADDPETEVKERAVFALSQLPKDEGVPRLIALARAHSNPAVRKRAMFWLGQSEDPRALAFFEEVLLR
jgi:hypothetical protein